LERTQRIEEKMGTKRSVLTDENGLPLAVVLSGANTHDVKLLEDTLNHIMVLRPEADEEHPQNLCLDAGYTPHIRPRGEEKKELERNPDFRARRWVVEVTRSFSIVFVNCWSVMKRKPTIIWLLFSLLVLLLSGANFCAFIANRGFIPLHCRKSFLCAPLAICG